MGLFIIESLSPERRGSQLPTGGRGRAGGPAGRPHRALPSPPAPGSGVPLPPPGAQGRLGLALLFPFQVTFSGWSCSLCCGAALCQPEVVGPTAPAPSTPSLVFIPAARTLSRNQSCHLASSVVPFHFQDPRSSC